MVLGDARRTVLEGIGGGMWLTELIIAGVLFIGFDWIGRKLDSLTEAINKKQWSPTEHWR